MTRYGDPVALEPSNVTRLVFSSEAQVSRVSLDMSVRLLIEELGSGSTEVVVNTPFELELGGEAGRVIDPEHLTGSCLSAIHGVLWSGVERVEFWPDGELRLA